MDSDPHLQALGISPIQLLKVPQFRLHSQRAADRLLRIILTLDAAAKQSGESAARSPLDDSAVGDNGPVQPFPERIPEAAHLAGVLGIWPGARALNFENASEMGRFRDPLWRSEEHTSELQSQSNLVCRLLLEKKK